METSPWLHIATGSQSQYVDLSMTKHCHVELHPWPRTQVCPWSHQAVWGPIYGHIMEHLWPLIVCLDTVSLIHMKRVETHASQRLRVIRYVSMYIIPEGECLHGLTLQCGDLSMAMLQGNTYPTEVNSLHALFWKPICHIKHNQNLSIGRHTTFWQLPQTSAHKLLTMYGKICRSVARTCLHGVASGAIYFHCESVLLWCGQPFCR